LTTIGTKALKFEKTLKGDIQSQATLFDFDHVSAFLVQGRDPPLIALCGAWNGKNFRKHLEEFQETPRRISLQYVNEIL
jgi:hypothetical protein